MSDAIRPPKFQLNQEVWYLERTNSELRPCEGCSARGWLRLKNGRKVICGDCTGDGKVYEEFHPIWKPSSSVVERIQYVIMTNGQETGWEYELADSGYTIREEHRLYATPEAAQAGAEAKNTEELMQREAELFGKHPNEPPEEWQVASDLLDPSEHTTVMVYLTLNGMYTEIGVTRALARGLIRVPQVADFHVAMITNASPELDW